MPRPDGSQRAASGIALEQANILATSDFEYGLPPELIAQTPVEPRDSSRLMVVSRNEASVQHRRFYEIGGFLGGGDLLVFNDTRVIPARLVGRRPGTGGKAEVLLLHRSGPGIWEALVRPGRRLRNGDAIEFEGSRSTLRAWVTERLEGGTRLVRFEDEAAIEACGTIPLPPYIRAPLADPDRYQTVYGRVAGSAAAPTAGLHFTQRLLDELAARGVGAAFVTLHVGLDTFRPVQEEDPRDHKMHREYATLPRDTARAINEAKARGSRVVSVGTTTARVLETAAATTDAVEPFAGWTDLFITPGHRFRAIDALITNFHLPRSTLLMLVAAFTGKDLMDAAYKEAMRKQYRFYSFGDAMLIG